MKKLSVTLLIALASLLSSRAKADLLAAAGANMTFETAADGRTVETRTPLSLRGGFRFSDLDLYVEYQNFHASAGTSMVYVSREHQEWILWGRKIFSPSWKLAPYLAGGAGFMYDTIETSFGAESGRDPGPAQTVFAGAGGLRLAVWSAFELTAEARVGYSQLYNPNPMIGLGLTAGFAF